MTGDAPFGFRHLEETHEVVDQPESFELEISSWEPAATLAAFERVRRWAEENLRPLPVQFDVTHQDREWRAMALLISPSITLSVGVPPLFYEERRKEFEAVRGRVVALLDKFAREICVPPLDVGPLVRDHPDFAPGRRVKIVYGPHRGETGEILRKSETRDVHWVRLKDGSEDQIGDDLIEKD